MKKNDTTDFMLETQKVLGSIETSIHYIQLSIDENKHESKNMGKALEHLTSIVTRLEPITIRLENHEVRISILESENKENSEYIKSIQKSEENRVKNQKHLTRILLGGLITIVGNVVIFLFNIVQNLIQNRLR